jgi:thiol:disulfide interchange protein DsbD
MHDTPVERVSSVRLIFVMIFATLTFYLLTGLFGKPLGELETFLPEAKAGLAVSINPSDNQTDTPWFTDYQAALLEARKSNRTIFIDFTGKTCTNCKKMERTVFPIKEIKDRMDQMVKVKLITDLRKEPYQSNKKFQKERFQSIEIPLYIILSPDEKILARTAYTPNIKEFIKFLEKGLQ